jgi:hypothetical protein
MACLPNVLYNLIYGKPTPKLSAMFFPACGPQISQRALSKLPELSALRASGFGGEADSERGCVCERCVAAIV